MIDARAVAACEGFDWDEANAEKLLRRHGVTPEECEEVFERAPVLRAADFFHPGGEVRHYAIGRTAAGRALFVVFTVRRNLIRALSARNANRKERKELSTS